MLYLITVARTGSGLPIEYKLIEKKEDLRTKFCRENVNRKVSSVVTLMRLITMHDVHIKDDRLIIRTGKDAYQFSKILERELNINKK